MTEQELKDELVVLQQNRSDLSGKLDRMALQLQLWDEYISLLQKMIVTLQTQGEQEEKLVRVIVAEVQMTDAPLPVAKIAKSLGG